LFFLRLFFVLLALLVCLTYSAESVTCPDGSKATVIFYSNGVNVDDDKAYIQKEDLRTKLETFITENPLQSGCISGYDVAYNYNEFLFFDFFEAYRQLLLTDTVLFLQIYYGIIPAQSWFEQIFLDITKRLVGAASYVIDADLREHTDSYQKEIQINGNKVVVVAHSQGNFYANESYSFLVDSGLVASDDFHIVAVATPASFVGFIGNKEPYTTLNADLIQLVPGALHPNTDGVCRDWACHYFVVTYLDDVNKDGSRERIFRHIIEAASTSPSHPNTPPTITSLTANPMSVQVNGQSTISVMASDSDGDPLIYSWLFTCGALSGTTGAANKTWTAPSTAGTCTVSVTVTDPAGASALQSVDINVTPAPSTNFATDDRVQVNTGDGSNLNVRSTPNGAVVGQQPNSTLGTIIGGPVFANGIWWWHVDFDTGADGWVAEDFLRAPTGPEPGAWNENFEGLNLGEISGQGRWVFFAGDGTVDNFQAFTGSKSLKLDNGGTRLLVPRTFLSSAGNMITSYLRIGTIGLGALGVMYFNDHQNAELPITLSCHLGRYTVPGYVSFNDEALKQITENTWYKLDVEFDYSANRCRGRVDNESWSAWQDQGIVSGQALHVAFIGSVGFAQSSTDEVWFDDISVSEIEVTPPEPELRTFTDPPAFQAALIDQTTITFDDLGSGTIMPSGMTLSGVTYTFNASGFAGLATNAFLAISPPNTLGVSRGLGFSGDYFFAGDSVTLTFAQPINAIGAYFSSNPVAGTTQRFIFIATPSGTAFSGNALPEGTFGFQANALRFVGLVSDTPFSQATLAITNPSPNNVGFVADNIIIGR
jgi:hypothetical protein